MLNLLNGGHTNQTTTFVWSLLHAMQSPLLETLRSQKSNDLLEATFRETARLYTNLMMLRTITTTQPILGKTIPKGTYIACSPIATARDPNLFPDPHKFRPERWLTASNQLDEQEIKNVVKTGASIHFGKGQHACLGEKMGRSAVMLYWGLILGRDGEEGFDVEIVDGRKDGVGIDGVGVEPAWVEENLGTPFEKDGPLLVVFKKRTALTS
jgi:sterol 14-demethylase